MLLQYSKGTIDDAGSVKGGCVVYLPEGIYKVSVTTGKSYCLILAHSNIVLKGAGAEKTFILNSSVAMRSKSDCENRTCKTLPSRLCRENS